MTMTAVPSNHPVLPSALVETTALPGLVPHLWVLPGLGLCRSSSRLARCFIVYGLIAHHNTLAPGVGKPPGQAHDPSLLAGGPSPVWQVLSTTNFAEKFMARISGVSSTLSSPIPLPASESRWRPVLPGVVQTYLASGRRGHSVGSPVSLLRSVE